MYMIITQKTNLNNHNYKNLKGLKVQLFLSKPVKAHRESIDMGPHIFNLGARWR